MLCLPALLTAAARAAAPTCRGTQAEFVDLATKTLDAVANGTLTVEVHSKYPLADAARAQGDLQSRATTGKLLLVP